MCLFISNLDFELGKGSLPHYFRGTAASGKKENIHSICRSSSDFKGMILEVGCQTSQCKSIENGISCVSGSL